MKKRILRLVRGGRIVAESRTRLVVEYANESAANCFEDGAKSALFGLEDADVFGTLNPRDGRYRITADWAPYSR
jgi:hypothetical protein